MITKKAAKRLYIIRTLTSSGMTAQGRRERRGGGGVVLPSINFRK